MHKLVISGYANKNATLCKNFRALTQLNQIETELDRYLLVCGGGVKNSLLMARLTTLLPQWQVQTTNDYGLDADYVEAAAFAWLAYQRLNDLPGNLPSVTGAKSAVSLGSIYPKEKDVAE